MDHATRTEFWRHHVAHYLHGQQTLRAYCHAHGLSKSTFGYWRRRLAADPTLSEVLDKAPKQAESLRFVELEVTALTPAEGAAGRALELVLDNGRCIRVPVGFDEATLMRLLASVESRT